MDGIIVIDKDMDYTSFDVVAVVRKLVGERHLGHTGTLDPNATGVLPICLGKATRLIEYMDSAPKKYVACAKLGITTDTQDIWGNVIEEKTYTHISKEALLDAINRFIGDIEQIPSKFSAIRVNGRHLYSYAHSGEQVEIPVRKVKVYDIKLIDFDETEGTFSIEVTCGRGTYVRTICNDIGECLGFGACMTSLRRTSACGYGEDDAISLEKLKTMSQEEVQGLIRPAETAVSYMNRVNITLEQRVDWFNGKHLKCHQGKLPFDELVCIFCEDVLCGIGTWDNPNRIKPVKVFLK